MYKYYQIIFFMLILGFDNFINMNKATRKK